MIYLIIFNRSQNCNWLLDLYQLATDLAKLGQDGGGEAPVNAQITLIESSSHRRLIRGNGYGSLLFNNLLTIAIDLIFYSCQLFIALIIE